MRLAAAKSAVNSAETGPPDTGSSLIIYASIGQLVYKNALLAFGILVMIFPLS